jgi:dipeptidyl aminopeptidase/acylaminoacyl peptidase
MGPYCYEITDDIDNTGMTPLKAADADAYIVQRMSSTESPNYFYTTDFKTFKQLSDVHPETAYNWLTSELINWPLPDGTISQGVLYKPQNFDPKKKYPVIFYYYEKFSDKLNTYLPVQPSSGTINIPWFVSHGYLVFTPDIHYKIGYPGNSALNAVVSAARYLSSLSYVDSLNMGIQGQSFGGYETNYIVTHSNLFKAACSVSGLSDIVSFYTGIWGSTNPADFVEMGQLRMGQKLWDDPGLYIENSPVFFANRVTTPILLMCNENDPAFYLQGISFFNALRRLGKRVWMLQYDKEGHELEKDVDTKDYTIRLSQFFDYYLKAQRAPDWMIEGVPAYKKGYDAGLELEPTGVAPGTGLLSIEEQRRVDSLQFRKPITVTIN